MCQDCKNRQLVREIRHFFSILAKTRNKKRTVNTVGRKSTDGQRTENRIENTLHDLDGELCGELLPKRRPGNGQRGPSGTSCASASAPRADENKISVWPIY
jgi:hypothetical protein